MLAHGDTQEAVYNGVLLSKATLPANYRESLGQVIATNWQQGAG
ncbi:hypothetical protein ACSFA0_21170 [Variovorax sp. LT1P1]